MADDSKPPPAHSPFADKGAARPLTRNGAGESRAAAPGAETRPVGLHTRPELFGARAVMERSVAPPDDASGRPDPEWGREVSASAASPNRPDAAPGPNASQDDDEPAPADRPPPPDDPTIHRTDRATDAPDVAGEDEAPASVATPAATLLDHPLRIPETLSFEDWSAGAGAEGGARSPDGASSPPSEAAPDELGAPGRPAEASEDRAVFSDSSDGSAGPARRLSAWLGSAEHLRRLGQGRGHLTAAAVFCAALLVAAVVGGVIPLGGKDRQATEVAQEPGAAAPAEPSPSPDETASLPDSARQDVPVAPAGSTYGSDQPGRPQPDQAERQAGARPEAAQLAELPDSRAPGPVDRNRDPIVDFMRIDPNGKAVVAGRAAPGTEMIVLDNGKPLGSIKADIYGLWTFVSKQPLTSGRHEIGLKIVHQGSEVSDSVLVTEGGAAGSPASETGPATQTSAADEPSREALAGADRPAATTAPPLPSDGSSPAEAAKAARTEESAKTANPAGAVATSAAPSQSEPGAAELPDDRLASQAARVAAARTAQAPQPKAAKKPESKPESPGQVQTAATAPAGGRYVVQLASFKNREMAAREQAAVEERFSDLLAGQTVFVQQVDLAEQGTYYRVRLGPFASLADARAACARFQKRDRECLAMTR